ncbi:MAG: ABC transporter permease subunit/CPBP intramembrane protease [Acidobacteriota bacterium]
MRLAIVRTIVRKELRETLRDRRTLMMMIVLPVLLYPLMIMGFGKLQASQREATEERTSRVAVWGGAPAEMMNALGADGKLRLDIWDDVPAEIRSQLESGTLHRPALVDRQTEASREPISRRQTEERKREADSPVHPAARAIIESRKADAVLVFWPGASDAVSGEGAGQVSVYFDSVREDSVEARQRVVDRLNEFRGTLVAGRQRARGLDAGFSTGVDVRSSDVAPQSRRSGLVLGLFLPFILVTMSLLGGFYPAIDLTAGEKERGTMQTLLCAPLRPIEIITGKFLAVWIICLIAALANVVSLGATVMRIVPGEQLSVSPLTLAMAFVMLLPVTFLFSAVFLALASFAKDFKDGQNFLTPVYMALAMPAGVSMLRGIELNAWTAFVPVVNIALLIKALLLSDAAADLVFLTLVSSTAYAVLALLLAARVFEREQVLLGGRDTMRGLFGLERSGATSPSPSLAIAAFGGVMVLTFYVSLALEQAGIVTTLLVTEYGFFLLPTLAAIAAFRFSFCETLSLRRPPLLGFVAAVLIGGSAWTFAGGVLIRLLPPPESLVKAMERLLLLDGSDAPLWVVWLVIAITPALCEEFFFRGLALSGLRKLGLWPALLVTALIFGLAHASIYRLLPTMFIGLLLTWLVWRTGSIWTGVIGHALNNGIAATLVYRPELAKLVGADESAFLDWRITLAGSAVMVAGLLVLGRAPRPSGLPPAHDPAMTQRRAA